MIKTVDCLQPEERVAKLEELLADKPTIAPGMEPAYEAYRSALQKELDKARAAFQSGSDSEACHSELNDSDSNASNAANRIL
jgi:hypothetical protein